MHSKSTWITGPVSVLQSLLRPMTGNMWQVGILDYKWSIIAVNQDWSKLSSDIISGIRTNTLLLNSTYVPPNIFPVPAINRKLQNRRIWTFGRTDHRRMIGLKSIRQKSAKKIPHKLVANFCWLYALNTVDWLLRRCDCSTELHSLWQWNFRWYPPIKLQFAWYVFSHLLKHFRLGVMWWGEVTAWKWWQTLLLKRKELLLLVLPVTSESSSSKKPLEEVGSWYLLWWRRYPSCIKSLNLSSTCDIESGKLFWESASFVMRRLRHHSGGEGRFGTKRWFF